MKKYLVAITFFFTALCVRAQVMTSPNPIPVGYTGEVTIIYDATKGNGALASATAIYAHTGLITSASSGTGDWKNVIGTWGSTSQPALTKNDAGKWELVIPNIYTFYNVPQTTDIRALAFVFHNGKGNNSAAGKTSSNGDFIITLGDTIADDDIWTAVEGVAPVTGARPAGVSNGIYYDPSDPTQVTLCTYAGSKTQPANRVFLIGDMTNWRLDPAYQMKRDSAYFWITLTGLTPGREYRFQYAVERADGAKKQICDLYSEKVLHPDDRYEPKSADPSLIAYPTQGADGGYVTVIQTGKSAYPWSDATLHFQRPDKNSLIIYEAWVYDFTTTRTFNALRSKLDYIQNLGVNAIELMPVTEFEGNISWGYNPTLYFAVDKTYGKADDLKALIDECHQRGIAVIVDMVFNHAYGQNPMNKLYPYGTDLASNPWFNVTPPEGGETYGQDWNHNFPPAHEMFHRVFRYWLSEYKIDGFRLDLSHGLCGTANNAVANLKAYYQTVKAASPDAYMILEHWGDGQSTLINEGMLCWTGAGLCAAYDQIAMGWLKPDDGGNTDALNNANRNGYVSYAESHDEERMQYKARMYGAGDLKTDEDARIARVPACVAFNVLLKGPHMLWQFEELGYDISIDYNGRTGNKPNPATKGYFTTPSRVEAFTKCAQAITLRTRLMPAAFTGTPTVNIGSRVALRTIKWGNDVYAAANFSATDSAALTLPAGTWFDYLNGATLAGSTYTLAPGELMIFTATPVVAPTFSDIQRRETQGVEKVQCDKVQSTKILRDGQILILRGDQIYTIMGTRIK